MIPPFPFSSRREHLFLHALSHTCRREFSILGFFQLSCLALFSICFSSLYFFLFVYYSPVKSDKEFGTFWPIYNRWNCKACRFERCFVDFVPGGFGTLRSFGFFHCIIFHVRLCRRVRSLGRTTHRKTSLTCPTMAEPQVILDMENLRPRTRFRPSARGRVSTAY